uniref:Uncharacterized protein n=1 Tax=Avena sativa TaxID=4498 RepID=A0ACD5YY76_AVESA
MLTRRVQGCTVLLLVFLLSNLSGSFSEEAAEEESSKRRSLATGLFCVAIQGADPTALQTGLNYACGPGHADCSAIQPGGKCYKPNDLPALASYAYNDYYQRNAASGATCSFSGTATTTPTDPSSGQCVFAGSSMAGGSNSSTPGASAPSSFVPPSSTFTPGFTPGFGSPAGSFNPLQDAADSLMAGARPALCVLVLLLPPLFFF